MKTLFLSLLALAASVVTISAQPPATKSTVPAPAAKKTAPPPAPAINRALFNPALLKAKAPDIFKARFTTSKGDFVIEVHRDWAPLGADRFYNLVKNGFFDNEHFFRVLTGFVVQFGLSPSPAVNRVWEPARINDDPVKQTNSKGSITFATSGPNTRTTQLFINLVDNPRLDAMGFSPFGTVIDGMDVVEKLYAGYGEGAPNGAGPDQGRIQSDGKAYLDKNFPLLDTIKVARVDGPPPPPPAVKKAAPTPTKATTAPAPPKK